MEETRNPTETAVTRQVFRVEVPVENETMFYDVRKDLQLLLILTIFFHSEKTAVSFARKSTSPKNEKSLCLVLNCF